MDRTRAAFYIGYFVLICLVAVMVIDKAAGSVQSDAYLTGTWLDYEARILKVSDLPCHSDDPESFASDGVIVLGEQDGGHAFYVPAGVQSFHIKCEEGADSE